MMSTEKPKKNLLDDMCSTMRRLHYSIHTERAYSDWALRFIKFHHFQEREVLLVEPEKKVEGFLNYLAVQENVAASTQHQAFNALVFLYSKVLLHPLEGMDTTRTRKDKKVPVVLTREEVQQVLAFMEGTPALVVKVLYGCGLRISEAVRLRVQDVDYETKQVIVRNKKGLSERVTPFPEKLEPLLDNHLLRVKAYHQRDLAEGFGTVYLPHALAQQYPNTEKDWQWQYVFPSSRLSVNPRSGITQRNHVDQSVINKAIKQAVRKSGIVKKVSAHTFRHSFATHLLQKGTDIRTIQALMGHRDLETTMIYTHVLKQGGEGVISPLDDL